MSFYNSYDGFKEDIFPSSMTVLPKWLAQIPAIGSLKPAVVRFKPFRVMPSP